MEKLYTVGQFSELIGKSVVTLQRWDRTGILTAYRSPSKRRYYTHTQYLEYMGLKDTVIKENVVYARVSSRNQEDDLKNQISFLMKYTLDNGIPVHNVYSDYGSGLNYKRKNWNKLLDDCFEGKINTIVISYEDRFVRFGFDWIRDLLLRLTGVKILVVENVVTSPEEDLAQDIISILHVFSCRIYGLRKYKKKIEKEYLENGKSS